MNCNLKKGKEKKEERKGRKGKERRNAQPLHLFTDCKQNHSEVNEKETEEMGGEVGKKNEAEVGDGQSFCRDLDLRRDQKIR